MRSRDLRPYGKKRHQATRIGNRRLVLQRVFDDGPVSRADIARSTGLGKASVSDITADLVGEGLVAETGQGISTGGKPPTLVELDPEGRFTVAVDLSRRPITAALLNLRGRIVTTATGKAIAPSGRDALEEVHRVVGELVGAATSPALGIGVGIPGTVGAGGRLATSDQLAWHQMELGDELEEVYGLPAYLAVDAEAAALAEFGRSGADPAAGMLYVQVDDRVAISLILDGRLFRTPHHGGDLTHLRVPGVESECRCGRSGCLRTQVSMTEILGPEYADLGTDARRRLASEIAPQMEDAAELLGTVLAATVAALEVDQVIIGGEFADWPGVPEAVSTGIVARVGWAPEVGTSSLGSSGVVLGAAGIVLRGELGVVWG